MSLLMFPFFWIKLNTKFCTKNGSRGTKSKTESFSKLFLNFCGIDSLLCLDLKVLLALFPVVKGPRQAVAKYLLITYNHIHLEDKNLVIKRLVTKLRNLFDLWVMKIYFWFILQEDLCRVLQLCSTCLFNLYLRQKERCWSGESTSHSSRDCKSAGRRSHSFYSLGPNKALVTWTHIYQANMSHRQNWILWDRNVSSSSKEWRINSGQ